MGHVDGVGVVDRVHGGVETVIAEILAVGQVGEESVGVAGCVDEFVDLGIAIGIAAVERQRIALGPDGMGQRPPVDHAMKIVDLGPLIEKPTVVGIEVEDLVKVRGRGDLDLPGQVVRPRTAANQAFPEDHQVGGCDIEILRSSGRAAFR